MKINIPCFESPPIPLEREETGPLTKDNSVTLESKVDPADPNSCTYESTVACFRDGSPEQILKAIDDIRRISGGQTSTAGLQRYAMARIILKGDALAVFNRRADELGDETVANCDVCLQAVISHVFPTGALRRQKRYMRSPPAKPANMGIKHYLTRYMGLNNTLAKFPPFGGDAQKLTEHEIIEHAEHAIPNSWKREMLLQGWDPIGHTFQEFVEFCERLEMTETDVFKNTGQEATRGRKDSKTNKFKGKQSSSKRKFATNSTGDRYCSSDGTNKQPRYATKTWTRDTGDKRNRNLISFIKNMVKQTLEEENNK